jgi:DNA polymerase elongation subunit (family B)
MDYQLRLFDFQVYDIEQDTESDSSSHDESSQYKPFKNRKQFRIQVFGIDQEGKTYCFFVNDFKPFFYIKVPDSWNSTTATMFESHLKDTIGKYFAPCLLKCKIVKKHVLYGFNNNKKFKFLYLSFKNIQTFNKVKNLFYMYKKNRDGTQERKLIPGGYNGFNNTHLELYEANIPPLLRYFHIQNISPSGWVSVSKTSKKIQKHHVKQTNCQYEFTASYKLFKPLPNKEDAVPYKICSFDIEASSSHGDFPVAKKNYKKLTTEILDYWENEMNTQEIDIAEQDITLTLLIKTAFGYSDCHYISRVFPKKQPSESKVDLQISHLLTKPIADLEKEDVKNSIKNYLEDILVDGNEDTNISYTTTTANQGTGMSYATYNKLKSYNKNISELKKNTIIDLLNSTKLKRDEKLTELTILFDSVFPALKGDIVTFIGSTFLKYGDKEPYFNHCIALDTCDDVPDSQIESYKTEKEVLLAWTKLIQREDPDIIIGYNIFGFDYKFMFQRAEENGVLCVREFLKLSRNKGEICGKPVDPDSGIEKYKIEETSTTLASGTHNLYYIKMNGRIQVDLYNFFRRDYNLTSYKLDYVSGYFISDKVKKLEHNEKENTTKIFSKNLTGLKPGSFIHFEEISHSSEYYKNGAKFNVIEVKPSTGTFVIQGLEYPDMPTPENDEKSVKWCLAKDDVTPQDIFRMTNEGPKERAVIAKYCIQDCNLVHHLLRKIDVVTGFVEMANICSVPIDFLVMRGQGIKLQSFLSKECRSANTLIPVLEKKDDGGYEGAIVLPPKCGLYLDEPVACVDYSSLYPSSMISENLSHDSKVWTREYDLDGKLIEETGDKDKETGDFKYDNLPNYKYVDINYDTYEYRRKNPKAAAEKVKVGYKTCRFAQFPDGQLGIVPRILKELLAARKATRQMAKHKTVTTSIGSFSGSLKEDDTHYTVVDKHGNVKVIEKESVIKIEDTYDAFQKNVFDKRQLGLKVTANSIYGQCGARTSSFYEKDVAASTTATGRKLLTYGKRIIEDVYGDRLCETRYGMVKSNAEYIYGDSVLGDTPIMLKRKSDGQIFFEEIQNICSQWKTYEEFKPYDTYKSNRREKQQSNINLKDILIWTSGGWSNIRRVIRHKCNKKIYRILTHNSVVDVTEDHSLLDENKNIIKPEKVTVGTALYQIMEHSNKINTLSFNDISTFIDRDLSMCEMKSFIYGFFMGDGSCGKYNSKWGIKYSWALNNSNMEYCIKLKGMLEKIYSKSFKILNTQNSSGVYKIVPVCGDIKSFVNEYICLYNNKCKIVPDFIQSSKIDSKHAFLCGYYLADGNKCLNEKSKSIRFDCKNKLTAASLYMLCHSLGYNISINDRKDKNVYRITCCSNNLRRQSNVVKKIYIKYETYDNFVYDIETDDGTFNTGFPLIVKNTDSVFMSFKLTDPETGKKIVGKEALKHTIELAKEAGELATKFLKGPHDLEYEKTFMPFCLLSKKRYVGMLYEEDPNVCYRKSMGIVLKRRDNAPIVKDVYGGIIKILMKEQDVTKAIEFTRQCLNDIVDEKYPLDKLIITKSLRGFYKNPQQIAHKVLADRIGKRDPGNKPGSGDRIPFVYIQTKRKVKLQGDKIEHPDFIIKNKLKPDFEHYITNQIMKPVQQVFALVLEDIPEMKNKKNDIRRTQNSILRKYKGDEKKKDDYIQKYRNKLVKEVVFDPALEKCLKNKNKQRDIRSFFS